MSQQEVAPPGPAGAEPESAKSAGAGPGQAWKVGELARLTGLTVRALHHYDAIGLLRPSRRTPSGHRRYDEGDVRRLYRVVALRELGLPLDGIAAALGSPANLTGLLAEHLGHVDRQVSALRALRDRLEHLLRQARQPTAADLLVLIEEVTTMEDVVRSYFTAEQLAALARRRESLGEQAIAAAQAEWPELIAKVQAEMDAGTDPADPRARPLAARWMELLEAFHGGDPGLRDALYRMHADNSEQLREQFGGPGQEMVEYVKRVNAAGP